MPRHEIKLKIPRPIEVKRTDIEIEIFSDGAKLGLLQISQGTVDWTPASNSVNYFELKWEDFATFIEEHGVARRRDG